eukprot:scaffold1730_cov68-Phaeocystis_antarctica.AAC.2
MNPESLAASSCEARADYKGHDFATGAAHVSLRGASGEPAGRGLSRLVPHLGAAYVAGGLTLCHAMKAVTPNLAVGGEGL